MAEGKDGAVERGREDVLAIFRAAVARVDPAPMVEAALRLEEGPGGRVLAARAGDEMARYALSSYDRVFAAGMGKASAAMALGLERALGGLLAGGLVAVKEGHTARLARVRLLEAGHPVPDARSAAAARALLDLGGSLGTELTARDLVVVLVSGGGSALLCAPALGLSFEDKARTTALLLGSGATIAEVNCVRKHLSAVKGGRLAAALAPATVLALVLSDVVGDELDAIASGPTVPDPTTFAEALAVVRRRGLVPSLPEAVLERLTRGAAGLLPETPKPGDPAFARATTLIVGGNLLALRAAEAEAARRGYSTLVLSSRITGEAREVAKLYLGLAGDILASDLPLRRPACVIAGGETTVTLRGGGRGGRNQEMALAFAEELARTGRRLEGATFLSAGTDGSDGPTDAAGALVDDATLVEAARLGLDPTAHLAANDSYTFFSRAGGHVKTGPTNTNVCDVQILLVP